MENDTVYLAHLHGKIYGECLPVQIRIDKFTEWSHLTAFRLIDHPVSGQLILDVVAFSIRPQFE